MRIPSMKPVVWVGSSLKDLKGFPAEVQDEVGHALQEAQCGIRTSQADIELGKSRLLWAQELHQRR
jgi:phage-related protein